MMIGTTCFTMLSQAVGSSVVLDTLRNIVLVFSIGNLMLTAVVYEGIYHVTQLDNLIRKTFQEQGYQLVSEHNQPNINDFYLPN